MISQRDVIRATFTVIRGGKADPPPVPAMIGFLHVTDAESFDPGGYGRVAVTPRPDGSFLVRPVRSGRGAWQDH